MGTPMAPLEHPFILRDGDRFQIRFTFQNRTEAEDIVPGQYVLGRPGDGQRYYKDFTNAQIAAQFLSEGANKTYGNIDTRLERLAPDGSVIGVNMILPREES